MKNQNKILNTFKVALLAFALTVAVQQASAQVPSWTAPTLAPPAGNTYAPFNVGPTGQVKDGGLTVGYTVPTTDPALLVPSGRVGVGITTPTAKLDVVGLAGAAFRYRDGSEGAGKVLTSDASGFASWQTPTGGSGNLPAGTSGQTLRHNGTSWVADSNLFNNGSGVGIGSTAPGSKLEVRGTTGGGLSFDTGGLSGLIGFNRNVNSGAIFNSGMSAYQISARDSYLGFEVYTGAGTQTTGSALVIKNNGSVGVGTAAPTEKLDVNGNVNISSGSCYKVAGVCISSGSSQWTTSGNNIYSNNTGNVGVGVTSPTAKLEVQKDVKIIGDTTAGGGLTVDLTGVSSFSGAAGRNAITILGNGNGSNGTIRVNQSKLQIADLANTPIDISARSAILSGGSPSVGKVLTATDSSGNSTWRDNVASSASNQVCSLLANKKYMAIVYGATLNTFSDSQGYPLTATVNGVSATINIGNHPDGTAPVSIPVVATADGSGCLNATAQNFTIDGMAVAG